MITLKPLIYQGTLIPHVFVDVEGGQEPHFVTEMVGNEMVYSHESGYGYLRQEQVRIVDEANA